MRQLYYATQDHTLGAVSFTYGMTLFLSEEQWKALPGPVKEYWKSVNEAVEEDIESEVDKTLVKSMKVEGNSAELTLQPSQRLVSGILEAFRDQLKDAKNYVEMEVNDKETREAFILTIQRRNGKTPHQLRQTAEEDVKFLIKVIRHLVEDPSAVPQEIFNTVANLAEHYK